MDEERGTGDNADKLLEARWGSLVDKPASRSERWLAIGAVVATSAFFFATLPFVALPLARLPAFIPSYEAALMISDLVTATLLFGQFSVARSRALLTLASGYLFTAFIVVPHALAYPDAFSPNGLLGAGPQTTAWLYAFWHGGFPLIVLVYLLLRHKERQAIATTGPNVLPPRGSGFAVLAAVAVTLAVTVGLTVLVTSGHDFLPVLVVKNSRFTPASNIVWTSIWVLTFIALAILWGRRRSHSVVDLAISVVMAVWLVEMTMSAVLSVGRFQLGWYAARFYGLMSANFLLIMLIVENGRNYTSLVRLSAELSGANKSLQRISQEDGLTDIANRRAFDTYLSHQIAIANRHKRVLALVLCDVDAFKPYNDHYGHQAGDDCLRQIAAALRSCCRRPADVVARYGGDEFAMILPDTDLSGAVRILEAARGAVAQLRIPHESSPVAPYVSLTGGAAAILVHQIDDTAHELIETADQALYQAKRLRGHRTGISRAPKLLETIL